MKKNTKLAKKPLKDKIYIFLILLGITSIIYFIVISLTKKRDQEIEFINKDFVITHGIVTKKSVYKGYSIRVK